MFPNYNSLPEVPEAFREHYVMKGGKAVPEVSSDHPLAVNNAALVTEKSAAETRATSAEARATKAEGDLAAANVIPRGHDAVPKADAELIRVVKEAGITKPEEFTTMKGEHAANKEKVTRQERRVRFGQVGKGFDWDEKATADVLELIPGLPDIEDRDAAVNGQTKKVPHAKIKVGEEVTFKPFDQWLSETHPALLSAVTARKEPTGTRVPEHGAGGGDAGEDIVSQRLKAQGAAVAANPNPLMPRPAPAA